MTTAEDKATQRCDLSADCGDFKAESDADPVLLSFFVAKQITTLCGKSQSVKPMTNEVGQFGVRVSGQCQQLKHVGFARIYYEDAS